MRNNFVRRVPHAAFYLFASIGSLSAVAQTTAPGVVEEVIVTGLADRQLLLDARTETGSRLSLTARETPASVDIMSQRQIEEFGARSNIEALNRAPGVTSSLPATSPGTPTMRGFGSNAVGLLYDGSRVATPGIFSRATDSWLYERIEILKGPASVMYGEGSLAGAINLVPKRARLEVQETAWLLSYGSDDTWRLAGDLNLPVNDRLALRVVATHGRSDGYVDDAGSDRSAVSLSAKLQATARLSVEVALDYSTDNYDVADYGTIVVPRALARDPSDVVSTPDDYVIDRALRRTNYNVTDGVLDSSTGWLRSRVTYQADAGWSLSNEFNVYRSDRDFINAEIFSFNPASSLVDRSTGIITHDIDYWVERPTLSVEHALAGMRNRVVLGAEFSQLDFTTRRYFDSTTSVDPWRPVRGVFPGGSGGALPPPNSSAEVAIRSLFAEDALHLNERWLVVAGARYDWIDFDRRLRNTNAPDTPIERDYQALTWRMGTVYDLAPRTQVFAQYSSAIAPVGNFLLLSLANSRFDLSGGEALEVGIKSSFWDDRVDATLAVYRIEQDDIITRDPNDPTLSVQGGRQSSQGVELSLSAAVTSRLRIDANYTVLDAKFDRLLEAGGVNRAGKTPPRIPETVANVFAFYSLDPWPVDLSAGIRLAGRFYTDTANAIRVKGYTTLDASIRWRAAFADVTLRRRNLLDEFYVDYSDMSARQFQIAPPRSVDITVSRKF